MEAVSVFTLWWVLLSKCQILRKLICDSRSSDSFAERSTVDYIVPGEMELMSAVRYYNSVLQPHAVCISW